MRRRFQAKPIVVAAADITAPTVPTNVTASSVTTTGFTLSWSASSDAVGVTGYVVQIDGVTYATPTGTSIGVAGRSASSTYAVRVQARDAAGNFSALSSAINVTTAAAAVPVAAFTGTPLTGTVPLTVQFTSTSTSNAVSPPYSWSLTEGLAGTPATTYAWAFGDGSTSTAMNPSYAYATAGTYTVALAVTNPAGSNTQTRSSYVTATPVPSSPSVSLFTTQTPAVPDASDAQGTTLSTRIVSDVDGNVTGARFYRAATAPTSVIAVLYSDASGLELARATFGTLTTGWNTVAFPTPVAVTAGTAFRIAYWTSGPYVATSNFFTDPVVNGHLTATAGYYGYGATPAYPTLWFSAGCYFADVTFVVAA